VVPAFLLLIVSNVFMTYAWYYHLHRFKTLPLFAVILISWGIAFFEYCFQVPGNRIGYASGLSAAQLKIGQEVITLAVFCIFAKVVLKEDLTWNVYVGFALVLIGWRSCSTSSRKRRTESRRTCAPGNEKPTDSHPWAFEFVPGDRQGVT
jgi:uncharacterized protein (DUF486 family)